MTTSLYLTTGPWDLVADASGNIAVCSEPYRLAQDAATAIRTWLGEVFYDTTQGITYAQFLSVTNASANAIRAQMVAAAEAVPGVVSAKVFFSSVSGRVLTGQVQVTDGSGAVSVASF